jgi:hypothetical protein
MRILVTGLSGFTGYYLQPELEAHGHTIKGLNANLTNPVAVATEIVQLKPEALVHLASLSIHNLLNRKLLLLPPSLLFENKKYPRNDENLRVHHCLKRQINLLLQKNFAAEL